LTWIRTIAVKQATGALADSYRAAIGRVGRVFGIVRSMSVSPPILDAAMELYLKVMFAKKGLQRYQREMLAIVVSRANGCHY
jgi:alkylhydroperoxidase family enzyme